MKTKLTIVLFVLVGSLTIGVGGVAAQATDTAQAQQNESHPLHIDDHVRVVNHEYDSEAEVFRIVFEADRPTRVTISESVQQPEGAGSFSIMSERILPGEQTVSIHVPRSAGEAAVSITTSDSISEGRGVYVSTGITQTGGPFAGTTSTAGWFGGASVVFAMLFASAWQVKRTRLKQPEELT